MNNQINDGGPAFPTTATATTVSKREDGASVLTNYGSSPGMTLRQYAAINLRVPDSGLPWLDEMIVQSNRVQSNRERLADRERLAAAALEKASRGSDRNADEIAKRAFYIADAMLKAREAK